MKPGQNIDIEAKKYHAHKGLGSTAIRVAANMSVAHFLARQHQETDAMRLGTMAHIAILEPDKFETTFIVAPVCQCKGSFDKKGAPTTCSRQSEPGAEHCWQHGGKDEAAIWRAALPKGVEIATQDEINTAKATGEGVRASIARTINPWILDPEDDGREVSFFAYATVGDDESYTLSLEETPGSVPVRGRLDMFHRERNTIVDLKGTSVPKGVTVRKFRWRLFDDGLLVQAALYQDLVYAATGTRPAWIWLVHEQSAPWAVMMYEPTQTDLDYGRKIVARGIRRWKEYLDSGDKWYGWPTFPCVTTTFGETDED